MRIGNIDDVHKSQNADNLAGLIQSESDNPLTGVQKWKNRWHYYKWYVICGIIVLGIACNIIIHSLGIFDKSPDFQIAYVGESELPQDTVSALEQAFAVIAEDFNADGEVIVQINQYVTGSTETAADTSYSSYASEVALIGDISNCDSYFFLMDDPDDFQKNFQLLAAFDGSCPDETDYSVTDKVIAWTDCHILSDMELGSYSINLLGQTVSGSNQELLENLFIGRRCFYTDAITDNAEECSSLWELLRDPSSEVPADTRSETSGDITLGSCLTIHDVDSSLVLLSNLDALAADGLYYASWVIGDAMPYENSDGDTVDLYDATLYLLLGEYKSAQTAQNNMETWLAAAKENYAVISEEELTCNGQTYSLITYSFTSEDNPYARGISAFSTYEENAVCVELTCQEQFEEDLYSIVTGFLECCTFISPSAPSISLMISPTAGA